jgi:hypothetical protein
MAATPTFDYLTIINTGQVSIAKYIVKARSINATYTASELESYTIMSDSIANYLMPPNDGPKNVDKELIGDFEPLPKFSVTIPLIKVYANSITIRTSRNGNRLPDLPLRKNLKTNQRIKIPFADISDTFAAEISQFIIDLDAAVTGVRIATT